MPRSPNFPIREATLFMKIFIRKETKNRWEGRAPLTPKTVARLVAEGIPIEVERSHLRIFKDDAYARSGAILSGPNRDAPIVLGIKEPELDTVREGQIHLAFSHTIKGQPNNMGLLRRFLDMRATLIDYETMKGQDGKRSIAFGRYAGIAGTVDTLHIAGVKYGLRGQHPFLAGISQTHHYKTISHLEQEMRKIRWPADGPRIVIIGSGNVGRGCEEVCRWLGIRRISAGELRQAGPAGEGLGGGWYCLLKTKHVVRRRDGAPFDRKDYRERGCRDYESSLDDYLGKFDILMQALYWEAKYPKLLDRDHLLRQKDKLPAVIGDISCDVGGALDCTLAETTIDEPAFTYDPERHRSIAGITWDGPTVMAISNLPCQLACDASRDFSRILVDYLPQISAMDLCRSLPGSGLTPQLQNATIVYKGQLTPPFTYLKQYL